MAMYSYTARDQMGRVVSGTLEAENGDQVANKLREMGFFITQIQRARAGAGEGSRSFLERFQGISLKDLALMTRQLSTMVNAGLSIVRALSILVNQTQNEKLRDTMKKVRSDVETGRTLAESLGRHPNVFSALYVNMVRAGETGGVLDDVLQRVSTFLEKEYALRQKIKSAMVYPAILTVAATAALMFMTLVIIPQFVTFFKELNVGELPLPTRIVMALSEFMRGYWFIWVPASVGGVIASRRYLKSPRGKQWFDRFKLRIPIFGPLIQKVILARFTRTLGTLLSAGVPLLQSFEVTAKAVDNYVLEQAITKARASIREGESIAIPLSQVELFPPMVVQMVRVGEESGNLDEMLGKVAEFYEQEVEASVASLASTLEPVMIVFMGFVVGAMVISLYLPIFELATKAK